MKDDGGGWSPGPIVGLPPSTGSDCNPIDCIGQWTDMTLCDAPCGGTGLKIVEYNIIQYQNACGQACPYVPGEAKYVSCTGEACATPPAPLCSPTNCMAHWEYGACSKSCGGGTQTMTWIVDKRANECGSCTYDNGFQTTGACNTHECCNPVHCSGYWTTSSCSASCDGGVVQKTWHVTQEANSCGNQCGYADGQVVQDPCNTHSCNDCGSYSHGSYQTEIFTYYQQSRPLNGCSAVSVEGRRQCLYGSFGSWQVDGNYASSCVRGCGTHAHGDGYTESRTRYSTSSALGACPAQTQYRTNTCNAGTYDGWTAWSGSSSYSHSSCTNGCGDRYHGQYQEESTQRYTAPYPTGACSQSAYTRTRMCNNGNYGSWSSWSGGHDSCIPGCGSHAHGGTDTASRTMYLAAAPLGTCKSESQSRSRTCNSGSYSAWGSWSGSYGAQTCSNGCGHIAHGQSETQTRTRYLEANPLNECSSQTQSSSRSCSNGGLSSWGSWSGSYTASTCTKGCGSHRSGEIKTEKRTRYLETNPKGTCLSEVQQRRLSCSSGTFSVMYGSQRRHLLQVGGDGWDGSYTCTTCNDGCGPEAHGQYRTESRIRYKESSPAGSCQSETQTRTALCSNGQLQSWSSWSGTFQYSSCSAGCTSSTRNGEYETQSREMYADSTPLGQCVKETQTRTRMCSNGAFQTWGAWSGSYAHTSCSPGCGTAVYGETMTETRTMFKESMPASACQSETQTRTRRCNIDANWGAWSGTFTHASCLAGCGSGLTHGATDTESRTRYLEALPLSTCSSQSQTRSRTCSNGNLGAWSSWTGTYTQSSCTNGCGTIPHGSYRTEEKVFYVEQYPTGACTAKTQSRTSLCSSGSFQAWGAWDGSLTAVACTPGCNSVKHGDVETATRTRYLSSLPAGSCQSETQTCSRTCSSGSFGAWSSWSGSFDATGCTAGCDGTHSSGAVDRETRTRFEAALPAGNCKQETQERTRTCTSGSYSAWSAWSGTYQASSCQAGCDGTPSGSSSSETRTMYAEALPKSTCQSESQTRSRTCSSGTFGSWSSWTGSFAAASCTAGCAGAHSSGQTDSETRTMFQAALPGGSCQPETQERTRACSSGSYSDWSAWSGTFQSSSCQNGCSGTPSGSSSSETRTMYREDLPTSTCQSETQTRSRTCTNGSFSAWSSWTGSFAHAGCTPGCSGVHKHNQIHVDSREMFESATPLSECSKETQTRSRTCVNGGYTDWSGWSGTFSQTTCTPGCEVAIHGAYEQQTRAMFLDDTPLDQCKMEPQERSRLCTAGTLGQWSAWSGTYTKTECYSPCAGGVEHGTYEERSSITYAESLPMNGCVEITSLSRRLCTDGESGAWSAWEPAQGASSCTAGCGTAVHGQTVGENRIRYKETEPTAPCSSETQSRARTCNSGTFGAWSDWSGTFAATGCTDGCESESMKHGEVKTGSSITYTEVAPLQTCSSIASKREKTCNAGSLSQWTEWTPALQHASCSDGCVDVTHSSYDTESRTMFLELNPASTCSAETQTRQRLCTDGAYGAWSSWTGSFDQPTCFAGCPTAGIKHAETDVDVLITYKDDAPIGQCVEVKSTRTRTCSDGELSAWGSWDVPPEMVSCTPGCGEVSHGLFQSASRTMFLAMHPDAACSGEVQTRSRLCTNGEYGDWTEWSGSYEEVTCFAGCPDGGVKHSELEYETLITYAESTPLESCVEVSSSRARACTDGTLGAWGAWDKTPAQSSCNPGCSIAVHGQDVTEERTMYLETLPNNTCTAEEQARQAKCQAGSIVPVGEWSGSYAAAECVGGCGEAKFGQLHVETRTRFMEELASSECVSEVQTRQRLCGEAGTFGEWTEWSSENGYTYGQCVVGCGDGVMPGDRESRYRERYLEDLPTGQCKQETQESYRTCSPLDEQPWGPYDGTYTFDGCTPGCGSVSHGQKVFDERVMYQAELPDGECAEEIQTRSKACTAGVLDEAWSEWSGTFGASGCTQGCAADEMHHGEVHASTRERFESSRPLGACAVETQTASLRCDRGNTVTDGWSGTFMFEECVDGCEGLTAHEDVQRRSLMVFAEEYPVGTCASIPKKSSRTCTNGAFGEWVDDREYGDTYSLCSSGCGRMRHGDETATQVVMYEIGDTSCSPIAVSITERCTDGVLAIDHSENMTSLSSSCYAPCDDTVDGSIDTEERTMYLEPHPFGKCVSQIQTRGRMCMNGQYGAWSMWDGTYASETCEPGCNSWRHDEASMQLVTMYMDDRPAQDCMPVLTATTTTCSAGDMVPSSPETNLTGTCMNGCGDGEHGTVVFDTRVMYRASLPDGPCLSETQYRARTCENGFFEASGQWNGTYQNFYCNPGCGEGFLSGQTRTVEQTRFVEQFPIGACSPEKRTIVETCNKGSLVRETVSGEALTYDECIPGCQTSRHGDTEHRSVIMFSEELPTGGCDSNEVDMTRTCDNATLSDWAYVNQADAALSYWCVSGCGDVPHGSVDIEYRQMFDNEVDPKRCMSELQTRRRECVDGLFGAWSDWDGKNKATDCALSCDASNEGLEQEEILVAYEDEAPEGNCIEMIKTRTRFCEGSSGWGAWDNEYTTQCVPGCGSLAHGAIASETRMRYEQPAPEGECVMENQTAYSACFNGELVQATPFIGNFVQLECTPGCGAAAEGGAIWRDLDMYLEAKPKGPCVVETLRQFSTCSDQAYGEWEFEDTVRAGQLSATCSDGCDAHHADGDVEVESRVVYSKMLPYDECVSQTQTRERTCEAGAMGAWGDWSGEFEAVSCFAGCGIGVNHGTQTIRSRVMYLQDSSNECRSEIQTSTRTCSDGEFGEWSAWSGTYTYEECSKGCGSVAHLGIDTEEEQVYLEEFPVGACVAETRARERTCVNGELSEWGDWSISASRYDSCSSGCGSGHRHGSMDIESRTMYKENAPLGACEIEVQTRQRICNKGGFTQWGSWSGTFASETCTPGCGAIRYGETESRVTVAYADELPLNACEPVSLVQTRSCQDGVLTPWTSGTSQVVYDGCSPGCGQMRHGEKTVEARVMYFDGTCDPQVQTRERACTLGALADFDDWSPAEGWGENTATSPTCVSCVSGGILEARAGFTDACEIATQTRSRECGASWGAWSGQLDDISTLCEMCPEAEGAALSRTRFEVARPLGECVSEQQTKSVPCDGGLHGSWSGSYEEPSCTPGCGDVPFGGHVIESRVKYASSQPYGNCESETQLRYGLCGDGGIDYSDWSGTYEEDSCVFGCGVMKHGDMMYDLERTFETALVVTGSEECNAAVRLRTRFCVFGVLQPWNDWTGDDPYDRLVCTPKCTSDLEPSNVESIGKFRTMLPMGDCEEGAQTLVKSCDGMTMGREGSFVYGTCARGCDDMRHGEVATRSATRYSSSRPYGNCEPFEIDEHRECIAGDKTEWHSDQYSSGSETCNAGCGDMRHGESKSTLVMGYKMADQNTCVSKPVLGTVECTDGMKTIDSEGAEGFVHTRCPNACSNDPNVVEVESEGRIMYSEQTPLGACEGETQMRSRHCSSLVWTNFGEWSGTFEVQTCVPGCETHRHGEAQEETRVMYFESSPSEPCKQETQVRSRVCDDGAFGGWSAWSGSYAHSTCIEPCAYGTDYMAHGQTFDITRTRFQEASPMGACVVETQSNSRICLYGKIELEGDWSGTFEVEACKDGCTAAVHGDTITETRVMFEEATPAGACVSESQRIIYECYDGDRALLTNWNGTFDSAECAKGCFHNGTNLRHGDTYVEERSVFEEPTPIGECTTKSQLRMLTCENGDMQPLDDWTPSLPAFFDCTPGCQDIRHGEVGTVRRLRFEEETPLESCSPEVQFAPSRCEAGEIVRTGPFGGNYTHEVCYDGCGTHTHGTGYDIVRTRYEESRPTQGCNEEIQERTYMCEYGEFVNLGNWSGTFEETECSAGCLVLRHGETMTENRTMFFEQLPAGQCQEEVQTRAHICIGGDIQVEDEWSGSYKQTMCLDGCGDKPSGELVLETRTRYQMQSGTNECLKQEQVRAGICADGNVIPSSSWSGTYTLEECTHTCVNQFGAKTLVDGFALFSRVRYKEDYPTDACKLEMQYTVQMCTLNGFVPMTPWDGSFTYTTCKDGCGSSSHGQLEQESRERFEDDLPPGPCTSETQVRARLCNEGTLTPWTPWQGDGWEFETCTIGCVTAGLSHGEVGIENRTMFDMDCDEEVQYRSRSCTAGDLTAWTYWNGTYQFATCNEAMSYIDTSVFSEQTSNTQVVNLITIGSTDGSDGIQGLGAGGSTGDAGVTGAGIAFSGTSWGVSGGIVAIAAVAGVGFYKFSKYRKGNADPDENAKKQMQRRLSKRLSLTTSEVQAMPESEMVALHVEPGRRSSYINPLLEHPA